MSAFKGNNPPCLKEGLFKLIQAQLISDILKAPMVKKRFVGKKLSIFTDKELISVLQIFVPNWLLYTF